MSNETRAADAAINNRRRLTPVWFLPVIALLIVSWLGYRSITQAGIEIQVQFDSGRGIIAGNTDVMHNGIAVGKVISLSPTDDLNAVDVTIEMNRKFSGMLTSNSQFWLVKPRVSFAGISGLDTLVSGNYIAFRPSENGESVTKFSALKHPPPLAEEEEGLRLTLTASELTSIEQGSPVYFRKLKVGEVTGYDLAADGESIRIKIYVKQEFTYLVHENTRFWNAGGIDISGNLTNLKVRTQSLISMVQGGVAFYTPDWEDTTPNVEDGKEFLLYGDYDEAEAGIPITIEFPMEVSLGQQNMPIRFNGFDVGKIRNVDVSEDLTKIIAEAIVRPEVKPALVEQARFWIVEPRLDLQGVSGLDTLLSGRYIAMDFNKQDVEKGQASRSFTGLAAKPAAPLSAPGLHLTLTADSLSGVTIGSPVLYRNIPVGNVESYQLKKQVVEIQALIESRYAHLVNKSSRFWNISGVSIEGNLSGFKINTATVDTLIRGGIAFRTANLNVGQSANGEQFKLFSDEASSTEKSVAITIHFETAEGLREGTKLKFRGMDIGHVSKLELDARGEGIVARTLLDLDKAWLATADTRFWLVRPQLGLANTSNLGTLLTGQYINVLPGAKTGEVRRHFKGSLKQPDDQPRPSGLRLELISDRLGSIQRGNPVYYREIAVGEVTGFKLANPASHVIVYINIEDRYKSLVSENSRFWNASGIDVNVGLFSGAKIRTESLEALLSGGISFATPDEPDTELVSGYRFKLASKVKEEWLDWAPEIRLVE